MRNFLITVFMLAITLSLNAQGYQRVRFFDNAYVEASGFFGTYFSVKDEAKDISFSVSGADLRFGWYTAGIREWHQDFYKPKAGFGISYFNVGKEVKDWLGTPVAFYGYLAVPLLTQKGFQFEIDASAGFALGVNPYDAQDNPENILFGSSLNAYAGLKADASFSLGKNFDLFVSGGIKSLFNGNMVLPNIGMNALNGSFGLRYYPTGYDLNPESHHFIEDNIWSVDIFAGAGKSASGVGDSSRTFVQTYSLGFNVQLTNYNKVGIMADFFTNYSSEPDSLRVPYELYSMGAGVSHELMIGRLSLLTQLGYSYWQYLKDEPKFYYRVGLRYRVLRNTYLSAALRTYTKQAVNFEFGINQRIVFRFNDRVSGFEKRERLLRNLGN
ncbi:MAG: hypothetical protein ACK5IQ_01060 [Bacteroidales bacterium]